ncbi:MAG: TolC family protein [Candidatus Riflebacteria bacterium]|nr:TolC family protein [Candidatus Riflebacteria bacterium]
MDLRQCLDAALERNPALKAAFQRWRSAGHVKSAAGSVMRPSLTFKDSYDKTVRTFGNPLFPIDFPDTNHIASLELHQSVYSGGKLQAAKESARHQTARTHWELVEARHGVVEGVIRAYLDWLQQSEVNEYYRSAIERDQKLVNEITVRVEAGKALEADRLQARIRLLDDQRKLLEGGNRAELARSLVLTQMDLPKETPISPVSDLSMLQSIAEPPADLGDGNAALRASGAGVDAAKAEVDKTRGERRPTVDVVVRQSHIIDGLGFVSEDADYTDYIAAIEFPIFDSGLRKERTKAAKANLQAAREEYRNLRLQKELELTRSKLDLGEATRRLSIAQEKRAAAAENLRVAKERHDAGTMRLSETLASQANAESAATEEIAARFDVYRAKVTSLPPGACQRGRSRWQAACGGDGPLPPEPGVGQNPTAPGECVVRALPG